MKQMYSFIDHELSSVKYVLGEKDSRDCNYVWIFLPHLRVYSYRLEDVGQILPMVYVQPYITLFVVSVP
jgi:hypothetical protein